MASRLPWRSLGTLWAILLCLRALSPGGERDDPAYTFHANPSEVRLTFAASDENNHGVATLQKGDFVVVDGDIIVRNFQSFHRTDWSRLEIAILIDASGSITLAFRNEIADALTLVSQTAGIPEENISIFSFRNLKPVLECAGNCRTSRAAEQLQQAQSGGLTPLYDTIASASEFLSQRAPVDTGRVLILFSDGDDTISRNSLSDALRLTRDQGIRIYAIGLGRTDSPHGATVLRALAAATGGQFHPAPASPTQALNTILEDFRATYIVTYRPPSHAAGFHTVRILPAHNLNLQFRSRSGYDYPDHTR